MKYLNNNNHKNSKTLGYSLILDVNPNLYSRNNPKSWVINPLYVSVKEKFCRIYISANLEKFILFFFHPQNNFHPHCTHCQSPSSQR